MKEISPKRSGRKQDLSFYTALMVMCEMPEALRFFAFPFFQKQHKKRQKSFTRYNSTYIPLGRVVAAQRAQSLHSICSFLLPSSLIPITDREQFTLQM
jgi:hypothetical protein